MFGCDVVDFVRTRGFCLLKLGENSQLLLRLCLFTYLCCAGTDV